MKGYQNEKKSQEKKCTVPECNGMIKYEKRIPSKEGLWLHGCAKITETIRRAIQDSKESIAKLSKHYNLNHKTIVKWRKRSFTKDADMGIQDRLF